MEAAQQHAGGVANGSGRKLTLRSRKANAEPMVSSTTDAPTATTPSSAASTTASAPRPRIVSLKPRAPQRAQRFDNEESDAHQEDLAPRQRGGTEGVAEDAAAAAFSTTPDVTVEDGHRQSKRHRLEGSETNPLRAATAIEEVDAVLLPMPPRSCSDEGDAMVHGNGRSILANPTVTGAALMALRPASSNTPRHDASVSDRQKTMDRSFPAEPPQLAGDGGGGGIGSEVVTSQPGASQESITTDTQRGTNSLYGTSVRASVDASPTPTSCLSAPYASAFRCHPELRVALPAPSYSPCHSALPSGIDTVASKYVLEHKIGEGTYGEVYRGLVRGDASRRYVALKRIKTLEGLDGFPLTSVREVIALKFLKQSLDSSSSQYFSLLQDVKLSEDHQSVFLVFDYVPHSLAGLCLRGREFPMSERDIAMVFLKILRGVDILHKRGIMHRDLKLDNVLVDNKARVMLCDFGLSVATGSGRQFLTPSLINLLYRPPEMLLGSLSYDTSVDVWSVGCMLAQVILREPPFIVRDKDRAGSELAQLERITQIIGPVTHTTRDLTACADKRFNRKNLEAMKCVLWGATSVPPRQLFSTWMKEQPRVRGGQAPSSRLCQALDAMLQPNASERPTVEKLLRMDFFVQAANIEKDTSKGLSERLRQLASSHLMSVKQEHNEARLKYQQR